MRPTRREFLNSVLGGIAVAGGLKESRAGERAPFVEADGQLQAGAATSNITPRLGVPLTGNISQRGACNDVRDELYARCLVLDNGAQRLVFVVCDMTMISAEVFDQAKELVRQHTGLSPSHMMMSATHSHSTPRPMGVQWAPIVWPQSNPRLLEEYEDEFLPVRIADGVRRAVNNLEPAEIAWGKGSVPGQVFNRRWHMKPGTIPPNPLGGTDDQVDMNPPRGSSDLIEPAGPTDPEVSFIAVRAKDGRPISLLANYSLHYVGGIPGDTVSADYFGVFADRIRELIGAENQSPPFVGILSNGTSGDVNNINFRTDERRPADQLWKVADEVASEVYRIYHDLDYADNIELAARERRVELGVRLPTQDEVERAREIVNDVSDWSQLSREQIYARETLYMNRRSPTEEQVLQAFRIGDLGVASMPCEVFAETGLKIKDRSPLGQTFTLGLANGQGGYLPTPRQHELGGYETWRARSSYLEVDAEPKMVDHVLEMFGQLV